VVKLKKRHAAMSVKIERHSEEKKQTGIASDGGIGWHDEGQGLRGEGKEEGGSEEGGGRRGERIGNVGVRLESLIFGISDVSRISPKLDLVSALEVKSY
jgi:hypothetical protein